MKILILLTTIYFFIKTLFYGIYEIKQNQNKVAGFSIIILSFLSTLILNIFTYFRISLVSC